MLAFIAVFGALGAVAGFLIGLTVNIPTAPVAAVELGIPAAALGTLLGGVTLLVRAVMRRLAR